MTRAKKFTLQNTLHLATGLGLSLVSLFSLSAKADNNIYNLEQLELSNSVSTKTGMYNQFIEFLQQVESTKELDYNTSIQLNTQLNSLKNYVLYPYALASLMKKFPDFHINQENLNYLAEYFPSAGFTQSMLSSYWKSEIEIEEYDNILRQHHQFPEISNLDANCAYQISAINKHQHSLTIKEDFERVISGKTLSSTCGKFLALYSKDHKPTEAEKEQVANFIVRTFSIGGRASLENLAEAIPAYWSLTSLYKYATRSISYSSYPYASFTAGKYFDQINDYNAKNYVKKFTYKKETDLDKFIANIEKEKVSRSLKNKTIAYYVERNYWKLPKEQTDTLVLKYHTDVTLANKIREKINSKSNYISYYQLLSTAERSKDEWQYWYAKALLANSKTKANGTKILKEIAKNQGFYPLLASKQLNQKPQLHASSAQALDQAFNLKTQLPWYYAAINEADRYGNTNLALSLWRDLKVNPSYTGLINWSYQNGLFYLGVQSSIRQGLRSVLTARFPDAYADKFKSYSRNQTVTKTFAQAIARQESAFNYNAKSSAKAYGLMQFIDATAKKTANKLGIAYTSSQDLYNPEYAIQLGTFHLSELLESNDNNRALTAIGYNAGPKRIQQWLDRSSGRLDFDEFVATIPFTETRNYVMNSLTFDYYLQVLQKHKNPVAFYPHEWNRKY